MSNGFRLDATGLEAVSLNLKRMKLTPRREIVATIDHDGALALTLLGRFPASTRAFVDGERVRLSIDSNGVTVHVPDAEDAVTLEMR